MNAAPAENEGAREEFMVLPWPPSANKYYRKYNNKMVLSREGMAFRAQVSHKVNVARIKSFGDSRLVIECKVHPPTNRKYDLDNRMKATQDALQAAGVFKDDEQIEMIVMEKAAVNPRIGAIKVRSTEVRRDYVPEQFDATRF